MPEYDKTNTFALFVNDKKGTVKQNGKEDKRDYTGTINVDGEEYWLDGYKRANGIIGGYVRKKEYAQGYDNKVPVVGTIEDGTVNYDNVTDEDLLNSIPF